MEQTTQKSQRILTVVHAEGKILVGMLNLLEAEQQHASTALLHNAIELLFQRKVDANGQLNTTFIPTFIVPFSSPVTVAVRWTVCAPLANTEMEEMYKNIVTPSRLIIPPKVQ